MKKTTSKGKKIELKTVTVVEDTMLVGEPVLVDIPVTPSLEEVTIPLTSPSMEFHFTSETSVMSEVAEWDVEKATLDGVAYADNSFILRRASDEKLTVRFV